MRFVSFLILALIAAAAVPLEDARNVNMPDVDTHFLMPVYRTRAEWEHRAEHLRKQILSAAGLLPIPLKNPLHPRVYGRIEHADYTVENVLLETFPGYYLAGNLYRPAGMTGKFPGVASPHGHWKHGRLENTSQTSVPARAINLARQGFVVFAYDMAGYTETLQTPHGFGGRREQLWSFGPLGLQLWNSIRVVDYLQSLPDVDADRIAATGESGGGTQTFLLTAVDQRVRYSIPVNMISATFQGDDPCENAPSLRLDTSNLELAALTAPRPMLLIAATGDWTRNTPQEEYPAIRSIYELFGLPRNLEMIQFAAQHNYNKASREAMYRFLEEFAMESEDSEYVEQETVADDSKKLLVLNGRRLPENALDYPRLVDAWINASRKQTDETSDPKALRERLSYALATEWPERILSENQGNRLVLSREGRADRVEAIQIAGSGPPTLVVHPRGAEAARKDPAVDEMVRGGQQVLLLTAFQTGSAAVPRALPMDFFLTYNRSDDANRVQDILTALAYLSQRNEGQIHLVGVGDAAVWCVFAAAVAPVPVSLSAPLGNFSGSDNDFLDRFFVPGIQRAGGLKAAMKALATGNWWTVAASQFPNAGSRRAR